MDNQLTIPAILRRAETFFGDKEIISRLPDGSHQRQTYATLLERARRLAGGIRRLNLPPGARVATLCWNHHQHLEAYYGLPAAGMVLHTLNPRLPREDLAYIMAHAGDEALLVDGDLLEKMERLEGQVKLRHLIVVNGGRQRPSGSLEYEELLGSGERMDRWRDVNESDPAAMCYTSGTTGRPKGVVYSHRTIALHSLATALPDAFSLGERDTVLAAVPMFHANAWGLPFTSALVGARQVLARNAFDAASLLSQLAQERVTFTAGVPTIWLSVLEELDRNPGRYDLTSLRTIVVGGAPCPAALIRAFQERHRVRLIASWGMTEMAPVGTMGRTEDDAERDEDFYRRRSRPGRPIPFVEVRLRQDELPVAWDGVAMGELEVRGPWVARDYYNLESDTSFTRDGWFRTGDIASIDRSGCLEIRDRAKDLIKSGGEWISSVTLEHALMDHPAVAEAAVIAIADARWQERPMAIVVLRPGISAGAADLRAHLTARFPAWYVPERYEFVSALPRTGTGKVWKQGLREKFRGP
jgi:fatty-acyl-CoA synthase